MGPPCKGFDAFRATASGPHDGLVMGFQRAFADGHTEVVAQHRFPRQLAVHCVVIDAQRRRVVPLGAILGEVRPGDDAVHHLAGDGVLLRTVAVAQAIDANGGANHDFTTLLAQHEVDRSLQIAAPIIGVQAGR